MGTGNGPLFITRNIAVSSKPGILEFVYIFYKLYIDYVLYKVYNIYRKENKGNRCRGRIKDESKQEQFRSSISHKGKCPASDYKKGGIHYVQTYSFYKRQFLEKPFL